MTNFEASVVVRRGNEWLIGKIEKFEFKPYKKIKKLGDVDSIANYKSARDYMLSKGKHPKYATILEQKTGLDRIYILDRPTYCSAEEAEENWWSDENEMCSKCSMLCKQSAKVSIAKCPDYKEKV